MRKLLLIFVFFALSISMAGAQSKKNINWEVLLGYAAPINESYVDTYQNEDIYWNPNSGFNLDARLNLKVNENFTLIFPLNINVGYYQYQTTDGRKVNTEAQAGTNPDTTNTEWSVAPDLGMMVKTSLGESPGLPYIALGISAGMLFSWETWEFTNVDGDDAKLVIAKYYDISPVFKGEIGWTLPYTKKIDFKLVAGFNMVNYIMRRVELTNYYIDGKDHIGDYDTKSTVYNYSFNAPDENKGGDCLLAGFTYNNYPQQKIANNFSIKFGISYSL